MITQITQVIQEIHDIKANKVSRGNKYNSRQNMKTKDLTIQKEHNRFLKDDTDGRGDSCGDRIDDNKWVTFCKDLENRT